MFNEFPNALAPQVILTTTIYACLGMTLMIFFLILFDKLFKLDLHKELVEDQNMAFGLVIAGVAIGMSIIIASSIIE